jgi:hypothetical protein
MAGWEGLMRVGGGAGSPSTAPGGHSILSLCVPARQQKGKQGTKLLSSATQDWGRARERPDSQTGPGLGRGLRYRRVLNIMSKKLFLSLVPLVATVAFLAVPAGVQAATPHYYSEGAIIPEGEKVATYGDAKLTLKGEKGGETEISCRNAIAGYVVNPTLGGAGRGATQVFQAYECEASFACEFEIGPGEIVPGVPGVKSENMEDLGEPGVDWPNELKEAATESEIRSEQKNVKVGIGCLFPLLGKPYNEEVQGAVHYVLPESGKPDLPIAPAAARKGTSCLSPGYFQFKGPETQLEVEGSSGTVVGGTTGRARLCGAESQQWIAVKAP